MTIKNPKKAGLVPVSSHTMPGKSPTSVFVPSGAAKLFGPILMRSMGVSATEGSTTAPKDKTSRLRLTPTAKEKRAAEAAPASSSTHTATSFGGGLGSGGSAGGGGLGGGSGGDFGSARTPVSLAGIGGARPEAAKPSLLKKTTSGTVAAPPAPVPTSGKTIGLDIGTAPLGAAVSIFTPTKSSDPPPPEVDLIYKEAHSGDELKDKEKPSIAGIFAQDIQNGLPNQAVLIVKKMNSARFKAQKYNILRKNILAEKTFTKIIQVTENAHVDPKLGDLLDSLNLDASLAFSHVDKALKSNAIYAYKVEVEFVPDPTFTGTETDFEGFPPVAELSLLAGILKK